MAKPPESHPEFGRLICSRRYSIAYWIIAPILIVLGLPFVLFGIAAPFMIKRGPGWSLGQDVIFPIALAAIGGLVVWAGIACIRRGMTRITFFEHGATRRCWGKERSLPYDQATSLTYQLTRQFINGIYAGTVLNIDIRAEGGQRLGFSGSHKEKAKGLLPILTKKFEGTDEMDTVRGVIAGFIADKMQERLLDGATLDWCRAATVSADGLTPRKGKHKRKLVPWSEIDRQTAQKGFFYFFRRGEDRSFVGAQVNGKDFWPTLDVCVRMIKANAPGAVSFEEIPAPDKAGAGLAAPYGDDEAQGAA